ncbi:MAG: enoyl-CoA hydratase [Rubrivivax sp.]|nr:enoyl-CoA hydratase [Rubrivivax sp.]
MLPPSLPSPYTVPYETLLVECAVDGFATLTFNRPDKLNTLSIRLRQELAAAVAALEADPAIHVLILTGAGRAFTAGLDLDEWATPGMTPAAAIEHDAVAALRQFSGPVIGAINGLCITGGVEMALACDLLVAASDARFADTHVKVGLLPGWGGSVRLIRRIGLNRAKELALTGRFLAADEALAWGLVNRVVPREQLLAEAQALARQMLANPADGVARYKRLLDEEAGLTEAQGFELERATSRAANAGVTREEIESRLARLRRQGPRGA